MGQARRHKVPHRTGLQDKEGTQDLDPRLLNVHHRDDLYVHERIQRFGELERAQIDLPWKTLPFSRSILGREQRSLMTRVSRTRKSAFESGETTFKEALLMSNGRKFEKSCNYQITVKGNLNAEWSGWFENLTITQLADDETMLAGQIKDQAELYGLLSKLGSIGIPLLSVTREELRSDKSGHLAGEE
jgi:hypothetical protein